MTRTFTLRRLIAASGLAAAAAIAMTSLTTEASASVASCRGKSPNDVLKCCQEEVAEHGRPDWMRSHHVNCSSASVACRSSSGGNYNQVSSVAPGSYNKCRIIVLKHFDRDSHGTKDQPSRSPNGNSTNGNSTNGNQGSGKP
jgi:hypothetical protein